MTFSHPLISLPACGIRHAPFFSAFVSLAAFPFLISSLLVSLVIMPNLINFICLHHQGSLLWHLRNNNCLRTSFESLLVINYCIANLLVIIFTPKFRSLYGRPLYNRSSNIYIEPHFRGALVQMPSDGHIVNPASAKVSAVESPNRSTEINQ